MQATKIMPISHHMLPDLHTMIYANNVNMHFPQVWITNQITQISDIVWYSSHGNDTKTIRYKKPGHIAKVPCCRDPVMQGFSKCPQESVPEQGVKW